MTGRVSSTLCGDVIAAYEPLLAVGRVSRDGGRFLPRPLPGSGVDMIVHHACGFELGISSLKAEHVSDRRAVLTGRVAARTADTAARLALAEFARRS